MPLVSDQRRVSPALTSGGLATHRLPIAPKTDSVRRTRPPAQASPRLKGRRSGRSAPAVVEQAQERADNDDDHGRDAVPVLAEGVRTVRRLIAKTKEAESQTQCERQPHRHRHEYTPEPKQPSQPPRAPRRRTGSWSFALPALAPGSIGCRHHDPP